VQPVTYRCAEGLGRRLQSLTAPSIRLSQIGALAGQSGAKHLLAKARTSVTSGPGQCGGRLGLSRSRSSRTLSLAGQAPSVKAGECRRLP
jgi:hypothetical protein